MHCSLHRGCFFTIWNEHRYTLNIESEWPGIDVYIAGPPSTQSGAVAN
jgi:hypothetical protein